MYFLIQIYIFGVNSKDIKPKDQIWTYKDLKAEIEKCKPNENGYIPSDYIGRQSLTGWDGFDSRYETRMCQKWNSPTVSQNHGNWTENGEVVDHNYCRDPGRNRKGAWCYTTDPKIEWKYCTCYHESYLQYAKGLKKDDNDNGDESSDDKGTFIPVQYTGYFIFI